MERIDGKLVSEKIKAQIAHEVYGQVSAGRRRPCLAAVLVGHDGGSETYVANKIKACEACGFESRLIRFEDDIDQNTLLEAVERLNEDPEVDGFIVQLPLPGHLDEQVIIEAIDPSKDVDGFHPVNVGKMAIGLDGFLPATPAGIMELLNHYNIETSGKHCVIIGRSNIVGKPLSLLMMRKSRPGNCTVTVCHSATNDLTSIIKQGDIVVAALGKPAFVKADMLKPGAVVIDVGTTRVADSSRERGWRLCGDVDFDDVKDKVSYITPVPGGVGPMTIVSLMKNTLKAYNDKLQ